jgi:hypothetical protein
VLHPYARRFPPRAPCAIDRWTGPGWRLLERHTIETVAPPGAALEALAALRLREMPAVRALFALRGLGARPETTLREFFSTSPFVLIEEAAGTELVGGVLLPRREEGLGARRLPRSPEEFRRSLAEAPFAAIATFRADAAAHGTALWTETWVRTRGALPAAIFAAYWLAIGPFSAWTRRIFLREARVRAERAAVGPDASLDRG